MFAKCICVLNWYKQPNRSQTQHTHSDDEPNDPNNPNTDHPTDSSASSRSAFLETSSAGRQLHNSDSMGNHVTDQLLGLDNLNNLNKDDNDDDERAFSNPYNNSELNQMERYGSLAEGIMIDPDMFV